jgi:hypothetical protein
MLVCRRVPSSEGGLVAKKFSQARARAGWVATRFTKHKSSDSEGCLDPRDELFGSRLPPRTTQLRAEP